MQWAGLKRPIAVMSKGQQSVFARLNLLDHLVSPEQDRGRDRDT
jgi:hypothetical protein